MGRRRILIASVAGCALCNVATAFAQSGLVLAWLQLAARFFLGLWILSLLYSATGSHPASITWVLLLTPISPLIILFIPETARRELEEISPD